ncbi:hypothetical protein ACW0JT_14590 [Arthrobacter sp. SA17]
MPEHFGFVVGIDTHAKTHTLAIINTASGGEVANETFPGTPEATVRWHRWRCRTRHRRRRRTALLLLHTGCVASGSTPEPALEWGVREAANERDIRIVPQLEGEMYVVVVKLAQND